MRFGIGRKNGFVSAFLNHNIVFCTLSLRNYIARQIWKQHQFIQLFFLDSIQFLLQFG